MHFQQSHQLRVYLDENVTDGIRPEIAKLPPQENITDSIPNQPIAK